MGAQSVGVAGVAFWRLGSEDPSLWRVLDDDGNLLVPQRLTTAVPGYDAELDGQVEILRIRAQPVEGKRVLTTDSTTGQIVGRMNDVRPVAAVMDSLVAEAAGALARLDGLR